MSNTEQRNIFLAVVLILSALGATVLSALTHGQGLFNGKFPSLDSPQEVLASYFAEYRAQRDAVGEFALTPRMVADLLASGGAIDLVDIREAWEFGDFTLPGARSVPAAGLLGPEALASFASGRKTVLIDRQGNAGAEFVPFLRMNGLDAYYIQGGLQEFYQQIMLPASLSGLPKGEAELTAGDRQAWRARFGGAVPSGAVAAPPPPPAASAVPPPAAAAPPKQSGGLQRGAGC